MEQLRGLWFCTKHHADEDALTSYAPLEDPPELTTRPLVLGVDLDYPRR
jgi:hypothetical protein